MIDFIKHRLFFLSVLTVAILAVFMLINLQPVRADHTIAHCNEQFPIGSAAHSACVNQVGNSVDPRCFWLGNETNCDGFNITNLTPVAPNCYTLTQTSSMPGNTAFTAQQTACPGVPTEGGSGFTPVDTAIECTPGDEKCCEGVRLTIDVNCVDADNPILAYVGGFINFLIAGVGLIVTIMLGIAGIQYMAAQGNPSAIEGARKKVSNAIIAFVTFIFMYAILQWLVPGGIF